MPGSSQVRSCLSFVLRSKKLTSHSVWSAFSDIMLVILPILLVYNLQMALHLKLTISFLMGLGVFAAASALLVTYYFRDLTTPDVTCKSCSCCIDLLHGLVPLCLFVSSGLSS